MLGIGEELKETREKRQITIDEVSQKTNVKKDYLLALEAEDFLKLPTFIHAKGFLKSYAHYLGLDTEQMTRQFAEAEKKMRESEDVKPLKTRASATKQSISWGEIKLEIWDSLRRSRQKIIFFIIGTLVLLLLYHASMFAIDQTKILWDKGKETEFLFLKKKRSSQAKQLANNISKKELKNTPVSSSLLSPSLIRLEVETQKSVWLSIRIDAMLVFEGLMQEGLLESWDAESEILVKMSDSSALELLVNGRSIKEQEDFGEDVHSLVITKQGIEFK
jgi:cytoskeletal protein RodZ